MIDTVCILAGGKATRLYPVTLQIPKSMIDINGKPFILHQLELLINKGIRKIILCLGVFGNEIKHYLSKLEKINEKLKISYSFDPEEPLGTGGAIKNALNLLPDVFWVIYGDSYLDVNMKSISNYFEERDSSGLMTVYKNRNSYDKSNVVFKDRKILKYDKKKFNRDMEYIDYGLGILKKNIFYHFGKRFDLADVYGKILSDNSLIGYEVRERFYEIGSFKGIEDLKVFLKNK